MPIHDWSEVPTGLFHDFHQSWSIRIKDALNSGRLPKGVAALVEQRAGPKESDDLAIGARPRLHLGEELEGGIAMLPSPVTRIVRRTTNEIYASRANRIAVKHHLGRLHVSRREVPCSCLIRDRRRARGLHRAGDRW
jgi:hypothetical protein